MKTICFHPNVGKVDITNPKMITLIIENKKAYWSFCRYLYDGFPEHLGYCSVDSDEETIEIETYSLYINNILDLNLNTKANLNALYKLLKKSYFQELSESIEQIQKDLDKICQEIKLDFDANLVMDGSLRVDDVFKLGGLQFSENDSSFLEQLTRYVAVSNELRKTGLVFVNHIRDYFSEDELSSFLKELFYRGITLINIETNDSGVIGSEEQKVILDSDLCSI